MPQEVKHHANNKSEFQLIQSYFSEPSGDNRKDVELGIGDDCAIVHPEPGKRLAFSIDTLIAGVHFPENTPPDAVAHKALAVNLSDLAAMGAEPSWFTLALTLPASDSAWLHAFSSALFQLARQYNIQLIGGDTTHGPLTITIQVCGYLDEKYALMRSGAQVDDIIAVTGPLGGAAMGLKLALQSTQSNSEQHYSRCLTEAQKQAALNKLNYPVPRIAEGQFLKQFAHAALDLSDGLISDLKHILNASRVGAVIQLDQLPLAESLACLDDAEAWQLALGGGDDYELCFTLTETSWQKVSQQFPQFTAIGRITRDPGLRFLNRHGQMIQITAGGYDHFG
jgi:thiamine-monophosphate kinase